jgi:predicted phosphoadenosine phosphosulfate sulfurtransferase
MFIDWETQYNLTITHISNMYEKYKDYIIPYWLCIPLLSDNSCSQFEPYWLSWDETKKDIWAREKPEIAIKTPEIFDFYTDNMTFEEFITKFSEWYGKGEKVACFVGIRTVESLNRYRAIARGDKNMYNGLQYSTNVL